MGLIESQAAIDALEKLPVRGFGSVCCCSLAGTAACRACSNNPMADFPPTVRTNTVTVTDRTFYTQSLPSAQPEIIHCKDCKWKQGAECVRFAEVRPFPDDFCSRAERREEGDE